jgi:hypothetical protein
VGAVQDSGFFLWLAWPVLIPWYVGKTRGAAGWHLGLALFGLILSPLVASAAAPWVLYSIRYSIWAVRYVLWFAGW